MLFEWWTTIVPIYTTQINASMRNHWPYMLSMHQRWRFQSLLKSTNTQMVHSSAAFITHRTYHAVHWYWRSELSRIFRLLAIIRLKTVHLYFCSSSLPIPKIALGYIDYSRPTKCMHIRPKEKGFYCPFPTDPIFENLEKSFYCTKEYRP